MDLAKLAELEKSRELTTEEKQLKKILEKEAKLLDDLAKAKDRKKKINEKLSKKRTHNLIVIASTIFKGQSAESLESIKEMAENDPVKLMEYLIEFAPKMKTHYETEKRKNDNENLQ